MKSRQFTADQTTNSYAILANKWSSLLLAPVGHSTGTFQLTEGTSNFFLSTNLSVPAKFKCSLCWQCEQSQMPTYFLEQLNTTKQVNIKITPINPLLLSSPQRVSLPLQKAGNKLFLLNHIQLQQYLLKPITATGKNPPVLVSRYLN